MSLRPHEILHEAAAQLKRQSPGMSLRAVAMRLGLSAGYWSRVLKGTKPFPLSLFPVVVQTLGLDTHMQAQLQRSILFYIEQDFLTTTTGLSTGGGSEKSPVAEFRNLGGKDLWLLEEWYYLPLLNLLAVTGFQRTPQEVERRLGLSRSQASRALENLKVSGFITSNPDGTWVRTERTARFPTNRSLSIVRKFHQMMIKKASEELENEDATDTFPTRLISGISFSGSSEKVKEASQLIEEALYKAAGLMAAAPEADQVFQLNVQLYSVTKD
jgi:uncharacterized protein (TIGR02147 family)